MRGNTVHAIFQFAVCHQCKLLMVVTFRSSFEGFFASKGAAYALPDGDFARRASKHGGM